MKKMFLPIALTMGCLAAQAYEYPYLTVRKADGTAVSLAVESLVITFSDGQLVAANSDGTTTLPVVELSKMLFESSPTDIITAIDASTLNTGSDTGVEVYSTGGMFLGRFNSTEQACNQMLPGIYMMRQNGKTKKIAVK